ncbi:MAG: hypothetical protein Q4P34_08805, partial [Tissierellia bacterium]|nr:hypothetical protein [Tissierellia bacterium]
KTLDDNIILVIISESGKLYKGSFYKAISESSIIIEMKTLNHRELSGFISKIFNSENVKCDRAIIDYIIDRSGYLNKELNKNLYNIENEVKKLISSLGRAKKIKREDVDHLLITDREKNIFKLTDSICTGDLKTAIDSFMSLNEGKEDNYLAFYMIIRLIRNLLNIKILKHLGKDNMSIIKTTKLSKFEFGKLSNFERHFSLEDLKRMHTELYKTEVKLKSSVGSFEENMIYLISELCLIRK